MAATTTATHSTDFQEQRMKSIKDFDETKAGVKGLSDSGITTIPSFFIHPAENLAKSSSKSTLSIPVIDLSQLHSDDHKPKIVEQIHQAAKTWGFFQVINHGSPVSVLEETITAVKTFHEQPSEVKAKFYRREEGRGVMYASNNDLYRSKAASWHDSLQVWMAPEATPEEEIPEVCRREVVQWDKHAKEVGEAVLELLGLGLGLISEQRSEVKAKFYRREEGRGVMYASNNDLYRSKAASWHDSLQVWMAPEATPENEIPEACRREVVQWDMHAKKVGEAVLELLGLGLGLESGKFKDLDFCGTRVFVGHIYPYCPQPDLTMGITSHTDPTMITVLLQNQIQGLQVKHGEEWVDVKPLHGGLIINIGDMLQIVSNGEYKSVEHRVLANSNRESRISIVMFMNLSNSAWKESAEGGKYYGPLPELLTPENPPVYRDFTLQEHLDSFYTKGLESKSLIDKITLIKRDN
uniref:Fe2OG dioxygenase domain-containing protein n=1 Tax=Daucus carota subsp. sativus TaxID=79200 RepID=A0A162ALK5_DAUCS